MRDGWEAVKLAQCLASLDVRAGRNGPDLVLSVTEKRGIIPQSSVFKNRIATADTSKYKVLEKYDIAYNPYLLWCGAIGQWKGESAGVVSPVYECFRVNGNHDPSFFGLLFESGALTPYFNSTAIGSIERRRRTTPHVFMNAMLSVPPLMEQRRIVDVVESVDNYIAALQERVDAARIARNAVLHELLNAGGDGWVETTLGKIAEVVGGGTPSTTVPEYWDGVIIWLTPTEVVAKDGKRIGDSIRKLTDVGLRNSGAQLLPANSVILTSRASVGFAAISECPLATNQGFQSLVPNSSSNAEFLMFWIQNNRAEFDSRAAGSTFKEISKTNVKSIKLLLPPPVEQRRIVEIVSSMDESIQASEQTLVEAKNLRSGLLSELLSGEHEIPESYDKLLGAA